MDGAVVRRGRRQETDAADRADGGIGAHAADLARLEAARELLDDLGTIVYPRPARPLTAWVGVGGSPQSIVRAAHHRLPVMLAIIGGDPARFLPYVDLFAQALDQLGAPPLPIGVHSPGHVAATDEEARERFWPHCKEMHDRIGAQRGWPAFERDAFIREIEHGSLYVGAPGTVARKIARMTRLLGPVRFQLKYSAGTLPHAAVMDCIERYGRDVVPMVRDMVGGKGAGAS